MRTPRPPKTSDPNRATPRFKLQAWVSEDVYAAVIQHRLKYGGSEAEAIRTLITWGDLYDKKGGP